MRFNLTVQDEMYELTLFRDVSPPFSDEPDFKQSWSGTYVDDTNCAVDLFPEFTQTMAKEVGNDITSKLIKLSIMQARIKREVKNNDL